MKSLSVMQVRSLGWEDPLEEEMTIHSSIFAEKTVRSQSRTRLRTQPAFHFPVYKLLFIPTSEIAGSYGDCFFFNNLKNCKIVF